MRIPLRLIAIAVGLATADAAAAEIKQPSLASIGETAQGKGNDNSAAPNSCASLADEVNAEDRSRNNSFREARQIDWRAADKTIADCRSAADRGDGAAAYALGVMYEKGVGVPQNSAEAAKWYRKSADLGLASAQTNLGFMYADGRGVPQNRAEAIKWTRMAADQGYAAAQYNLGQMYCDHRGEPQDLVQAYMWFNLAAAQGLRQAAAARDQVAAWIGSSAEIAKAQQLAATWSPTGARLAGDYQPRP